MPQTIFGNAVPSSRAGNDGAAYSLGTYFQPQANGEVRRLRRYAPLGVTPGYEGTVTGALFRLLDSAQIGPIVNFPAAADAWVYSDPYPVPVPLLAGVDYAVVYWTPGDYVATPGYFNEVRNPTELRTPVSAGRFFGGGSDPDLPVSGFGNAGYFADVEFWLDGEGEEPDEVDTTGTAAALAAATAAVTSTRPTEGLGQGAASAASQASTARPVSGTAAAILAATAARSTARVTTGRAEAWARGRTYTALVGAAPLLVTRSRPARLVVPGGQARIVTSTTSAK